MPAAGAKTPDEPERSDHHASLRYFLLPNSGGLEEDGLSSGEIATRDFRTDPIRKRQGFLLVLQLRFGGHKAGIGRLVNVDGPFAAPIAHAVARLFDRRAGSEYPQHLLGVASGDLIFELGPCRLVARPFERDPCLRVAEADAHLALSEWSDSVDKPVTGGGVTSPIVGDHEKLPLDLMRHRALLQ